MYALMFGYIYALAEGEWENARMIREYCNNNKYDSIIGSIWVATCACLVAYILNSGTALIFSFGLTFCSKFLIIILPTITCNIQQISKMKKYLFCFSYFWSCVIEIAFILFVMRY